MLAAITTTEVAVVNAVLAWAAGMAHIYAAVYTSGWLRRMFIAIASLALFYSLAYWWLAWHPDRGADWSVFLRPFGVITWIVAWGIEPILLVRYLGSRAGGMKRYARDTVEQVRAESEVAFDES